MSGQPAQSYGSHRRYVPLYHVVLFALLTLYLGWTAWHVIRRPSVERGVDLMMALAFLVMFTLLRTFPARVQDRVIRLEERGRYQRLLPPDLLARGDELSIRQIVALRFASDAELPGLVRRALDERLGADDIKRAVQDWRADHLRI